MRAFVGFALVGVTLFYASLNLAIEGGGVSLAFVLLYTAPAFVAVFAAALLGERLTRAKALLVAISILGVVLVSTAGGVGVTPTPAAVAWGLTAGLSYASYYVFGKWALRRYRPVTIFAFVMPVGAIGLLPLVGFEVLKVSSAGVWFDLALMVFCPLLIGACLVALASGETATGRPESRRRTQQSPAESTNDAGSSSIGHARED